MKVNPEAARGNCEEKKANFVVVPEAINFAGPKPRYSYSIQMNIGHFHSEGF
jgi:hypothetical protein